MGIPRPEPWIHPDKMVPEPKEYLENKAMIDKLYPFTSDGILFWKFPKWALEMLL